MSGVFLSYSRSDRDTASAIIKALRALGVSVWWDEDMHSIDWNKELERQIVELATIAVLWTPNSIESDNVKDEARLGLESSKLINILVGLPKPPYPFDRVNGLPLDGWVAGAPHNGWTRLVQTIEEKVVHQGGATRGDFTNALAREEEVREKKVHNLARAEEALEEAQAREAETAEAAQAAQTTYVRAEEQHVRVLEMRATHLILSAATQEFEAARAAKEDADRAARAAKGEVKGAQREVALAKAALDGADTEEGRKKPKAAPKIETAKSAEAAPEAKHEPSPAEKPAATPAAPVAAAAVPAAQPAPAARPAPAAPPPAPAKPAPAAVAAPATARSGSSNLIVGGAAAVLLIMAGVGFFVLNNRPKAPAPAPAAPAAAASAAPAADPHAAAIKIADTLSGNWALQGLTCDSPVVIDSSGGHVSMTVAGTTSTAAVDSSPQAGVIDVTAGDGGKYVYALAADKTLSVTDPKNQVMKLTRCGG